MADKIRWGILSTAKISDTLIAAMRASARSELVAVASRNLDVAQAHASERNIPKSYGSYQALLDDPQVDVVYNPLPNTLHGEWTVKAAESGKHVLCEKPLVTTLSELDAVQAAQQANLVTIFEAFAYLHHPQTLAVKEMIQAGKLGGLQLINSWLLLYFQPDKPNIRFDPHLAGGCLWDIGVYPNSLAVVLAKNGTPVEVWASQNIGETSVDLSIFGQLRFGNGTIAQITGSYHSPAQSGAVIVGDRGYLHVHTPFTIPGTGDQDTLITYVERDGRKEEIVIPAKDAYLAEVEAMEACVLDGAEPVVPLRQSRQFLKCVLALHQSAASGTLISV